MVFANCWCFLEKLQPGIAPLGHARWHVSHVAFLLTVFMGNQQAMITTRIRRRDLVPVPSLTAWRPDANVQQIFEYLLLPMSFRHSNRVAEQDCSVSVQALRTSCVLTNALERSGNRCSADQTSARRHEDLGRKNVLLQSTHHGFRSPKPSRRTLSSNT